MKIANPVLTKVYNPLEHIQASTSAVRNEVEGVCPKCGANMVTAKVSEPNDEVHYCPKCRVASPKGN